MIVTNLSSVFITDDCKTTIKGIRARVYKLVSFQKDLSLNPSHSNTNIPHSNKRSTPLKLIYIISSIYKAKIKYFKYFLLMHQVAQNEQPKVVS